MADNLDDRSDSIARAIERAAGAILRGRCAADHRRRWPGSRFGAAGFPRQRRLLEGVSAVCAARPVVCRSGQPDLVPARSRASLGILRTSLSPLSRHGAARRLCDPAPLGRDPTGGIFCFYQQCGRAFPGAGFDDSHVLECHGSIHHLQCREPCSERIWPAGCLTLDVDPATFRARAPLPQCPDCGGLARPNILMFGDHGWLDARAQVQAAEYGRWLAESRRPKMVVVELGAGTAVPTVRDESERARVC